jgi:hypothetical protein
MKTVLLLALTIVLAGSSAYAIGSSNFAGEYADKKFLKGQGVFQLSLEQQRSEVSVFFSAGYSNGSGAAPEADGKGKVTGKGTVEFTWTDSFNNSGTGTIKKSGNDVLISIKTTHVADSRCLPYYGENMRLGPAGKK